MGGDVASGRVLEGLSPASRKSLSEEVLDRLREAIVRGRFEPGSRLSESVLAEAFGVSRGPVREALSHLQQEGLVELQRHRAARVGLRAGRGGGGTYRRQWTSTWSSTA